jgi:hypothetical protein
VKYTNLPYVNIGKAQAGRRTWIPLERLSVHPEQVLKRMGHLTPALYETVKKVHKLNNAASMIGAVANKILSAISPVSGKDFADRKLTRKIEDLKLMPVGTILYIFYCANFVRATFYWAKSPLN